ncbi:cathepsin O-like [Brevipalpus obovatus]|uniref:cathepsin O-like n=1 Tax=Brevipalpus obovatus TaxID=246614 RepID=UPI003D9EA5BD
MWFTILWVGVFLWSIASQIENEEREFMRFMTQYNKGYEFGSVEYQQRLGIFKNALARIDSLNEYRPYSESAVFGLNRFADWTQDEFSHFLIRKYRQHSPKNHHKFRSSNPRHQRVKWSRLNDVPRQIDWREKKVIGDVIDQGDCGSCWAHTIADTISSMVAIRTRKWTKLSAQQILECLPEESGCEGGDLCTAVEWLYKNKILIETEHEYPDIDGSGPCKAARPDHGVRISNYTCGDLSNKEDEMIRSLAFHGPLMAAVDASIWKFYVNGTIDRGCGNDPNHAVQIVGYNLDGKPPYFIVRNSWGKEFGVDGYIQLSIGNNTCAIAEEVSALTVEKA